MLERAKRASHIDPPASSYAIMRRARPTAERTLNPARMFTESLTPGPELENRLLSVGSLATHAYSPLSTHASFFSHLWSFMQAGHWSGIVIPPSDLNLIVSVLRPVGTAFPTVGQVIMILGITGRSQLRAYVHA